MGISSQKCRKQWSIGTLNYAGITRSPFQFYSGTEQQIKELQDLSNIFWILYEKSQKKININSYYDNKKVWKLDNLDKNMQRQRYCPLYRKDVGIANGNLMSRKQFETKWDQQYKKNQHYVKFNPKSPKQQQIEDCKLYDYLIFKTFVEYIFNTGQFKNKSKQQCCKLQERETSQWRHSRNNTKRRKVFLEYENLLNKYFQRPYLKFDIKFKRINQYIEQNDVLFLQDVSDELINALKNEGKVNIITCQNSESAIILRESFNKIYDQKKILKNLLQPVLKPQKFKYSKKDNESIVCFVDQFILINVHLSSTDGYIQIVKFMKHLLDLKQVFPSLTIIAAGDFNKNINKQQIEKMMRFPNSNQGTLNRNQSIQSPTKNQNIKYNKHLQIHDKNCSCIECSLTVLENFYSNFFVYPKNANLNTTSKKRTRLQSQNHKGQVSDSACRDFLIISNNLTHSNERMIPNEDSQLLSQRHPFDHKLLCMNVKLNK